MQPSAGPALPHTRTRTVHWLSTAAALAAVVAAVALVQPAGASAGAAGDAGSAGHPAGPVPAPDPGLVDYPLTCPPGAEADVVDRVSGDLDRDGSPETVVVVRCHSELGTPPSGVYVIGAPAAGGGAPHIVETLVEPEDDRQITDFRLDGRTVRATVLGFSTDSTPRCCPDMRGTYAWEWRGNRYVAITSRPANSI
ncbi:hypothetical protein [Streptomyces sp.]|uniref:hypothetical protein n=1 Tax=Streptomyces sp. TaxID=1931 RepID=UPI002F3F6BD8